MEKGKLKICFLIILAVIFSCSELDEDRTTLDVESNGLEVIKYNNNLNTEISFNEDNLKVNYKSYIDQNKVISEVTFIDNISKEIIYSDTFEIDKGKKAYKLGVFEDIEESSTDSKNKLSFKQWVNIQKTYETFLKSLSKTISLGRYHSDLIQSAFYHLSIYNTIIRSINSKKDCECTPLPAYFVGKSAFWCQEDYYFDVEELYHHYTQNKELLFSFEGGEKEYNYIKNIKDTKDSVALKDLFKLHISISEFKKGIKTKFDRAQNKNKYLYKAEDAEDCLLGLGSDIGCCGNYDGCCYLATLNCWRHDLACLGCDKWHCGPQCEPLVP